MTYRVQEISVDGSYIHEERFGEVDAAIGFADAVADHAEGSPWLVAVAVFIERAGLDANVYRVEVAR